MSIKEVMKIGCEEMTDQGKVAEQDRRLAVVIRINKIGSQIDEAQAVKDEKKVRNLKRTLNKIKGDEREWLRQAAWFLYM